MTILTKVVLIGDAQVGKSKLLRAFDSPDEKFSEEYEATIGVDFALKTFDRSTDKEHKLQLWDTSGQERFRVITKIYLPSAKVILLCVDPSQPETLTPAKLESWKKLIQQEAPKAEVFLIATRADEATLTAGQRQQCAAELQITEDHILECSAKTKLGLDVLETKLKTAGLQQQMVSQEDEILSSFQNCQETLKKLSDTLMKRGHGQAAKYVNEILLPLSVGKNPSFQKIHQACSDSLTKLNDPQKWVEFNNHRGAKKVLLNVAAMLVGLIIGTLIYLGVTKDKRSGFWLNPTSKTNTSKQIEAVENILKSVQGFASDRISGPKA